MSFLSSGWSLARSFIFVLIWGFVLCAFYTPAQATIGVGVGSGKVVVNDILKPGSIYELPPITVMNTGDEVTTYEMAITYHEQQIELEPKGDWFSFEPQTFTLEPKQTQMVKIMLQVPLKLRPGEYFSYIESHPVMSNQAGVTRVGIAAASKLYFTVAPANIWSGIYYRLLSLWENSQPWGERVLLLLLVVLTVAVFLKYFKVEIGVKSARKQ